MAKKPPNPAVVQKTLDDYLLARAALRNAKSGLEVEKAESRCYMAFANLRRAVRQPGKRSDEVVVEAVFAKAHRLTGTPIERRDYPPPDRPHVALGSPGAQKKRPAPKHHATAKEYPEVSGASVQTVSGGAPGLGKRR